MKINLCRARLNTCSLFSNKHSGMTSVKFGMSPIDRIVK